MRICVFPSSLVKKVAVIVTCVVAISSCWNACAGMRGRGKYSGVVVFDRWDTCFLLNGLYIMYIADGAKEPLRPYKGEAIEVNATDVFQPINPGDALIRNYQIIGPAKLDPHLPTDGVRIEVASDFFAHGAPAFIVTVRNVTEHRIKVAGSQIGPTLLGQNKDIPLSPSDGRSVARITRASLTGKPTSAMWTSKIDGSKISATYLFNPVCTLPNEFELEPGQSVSCRLVFKVSPGQYQFMVGYGGGSSQWESIVSNAISFDVDQRGGAVLISQ